MKFRTLPRLAAVLGAASLLAVSCGTEPVATPEINLIPRPVSMTQTDGTFKLKSGMTVSADTSLAAAARYLTEALQASSALQLEAAAPGKTGNIDLRLGLQNDNPEAYTLTVNADGVTIQGASPRGVLMGIATLRQLVPVDSKDSRLPYVTISDAPRFDWRGMHLDVSRHFFTADQVKDFIDLMATYKFNKFHWHLTDDQGWRIEIKQYPLLTEKGAWRKFNGQDRQCMAMAIDEDNPDMELPRELMKIENGDTLYGGYYTQEQIKEVVAYAAERGIDVIPELDMPGHLMGAQQGYPWITCNGESSWGQSFSSPLCPGKDSAVNFAKNIYSEVFALFPYEYVHLGADEVEKTNWKACPDCQARIAANNLANEEELQAWFVHDMERHFNANGKKLIGWDEIVDGGLSPTATITWWRDWAPKAVTTATAQGNQVILCPDFLLYLDFMEQGGDLRRIYETEPTTYRADWSLTPEQKKNIRGVQANIWCERIPSVRRMQYQAMPRMFAISELGWSQPEAKDWADFQKRFVAQINHLDRIGVNYRIPDLTGFNDINVFVDTARVEVNCVLPNIQIRYTTDGTMPNAESTLYTGPITVTESTKFTFRPFRPDGTAGAIQTAEYRKESYSPAQELPEAAKPGIGMVQHEFKGNKCAEIEAAKTVARHTLDSVAIPTKMAGWLGLVYEGYFEVPADGIYTFALTSNDGSMLYIDGAMLIDNDGPHSDRCLKAQRALAKGWHKIRVDFFDMNNGGSLALQWATPGETGLKTLTGFQH